MTNKELSSINENSKYSSSMLPSLSSNFETEKRRPSKSIKDRLVKDTSNLEL